MKSETSENELFEPQFFLENNFFRFSLTPRLKHTSNDNQLYCYVDYEIQHPTTHKKLYGKTRNCVYYEFSNENLVAQLWDEYFTTEILPLTKILFKICSFRLDNKGQNIQPDRVITCGKLIFDNSFIEKLTLNSRSKYEYVFVKMDRPKNNPNKEALYSFSDNDQRFFQLRIKIFNPKQVYQYFQQKSVQMFLISNARQDRLESLDSSQKTEVEQTGNATRILG